MTSCLAQHLLGKRGVYPKCLCNIGYPETIVELAMTEEAIENELNCSITYTNQKILQCFHVYCQKCLVKLVVRDQQGQHSLSCPMSTVEEK